MPTKLKHKNSVAGATLIELLVSVVIGLIVLAAVMAIASKTIQANSAIIRSARLNQDLGVLIQVMVDDIRRAGYNSCVDNPTTTTVNECCIDSAKVPPVVCPTEERKDLIYRDDGTNLYSEDLYIDRDTPCILYSYNRNSDARKNRNERLGFKLEDDEVKTRTSCGEDADFDANYDDCSKTCSLGSWEPISQKLTNTPSVTSLVFASTGAKCQETTHADPVEPKPRLGKNGNYWITTGSTATNFPCTATSGDDLTIYALDTSNVYQEKTDGFEAPTMGSNPPLTSDRTTEIRQVNVTLEGQIKRPAQFDATASRKKLEVSIKVRNDRIRKHSS